MAGAKALNSVPFDVEDGEIYVSFWNNGELLECHDGGRTDGKSGAGNGHVLLNNIVLDIFQSL